MKEKDVQIEAIKIMEAQGVVYWFPPRTWGERDILGVFDFIAVRKSKALFVQLTTLQHISDRRKKIQSFFLKNNIAKLENVFIWAWDKKKLKFKVLRL